jgi:2',3'-cyclic-nucleotide 2'-phosphodiesterase (5'-nucleotidase family)
METYIMRLLSSFLVLLAFVLSCSGRTVSDGRFVTLKVYHTNDIHSHLLPDAEGKGGLAYLSSVLKIIKEQQSDSLILDAGDFYNKGSLPSRRSDELATADILSVMPYYDLRAVGNNEVKVGIAKLLEWSRKKESAPLLSANLVDRDGKTLFQSHQIVSRAGLKVGVIGTTPVSSFEDGTYADKDDPRAPYRVLAPKEVLPALVKKIRPEVDVLILLSHLPFARNQELALLHPEIDLVVSGHSHVLTPDQKKEGVALVAEAGEFGRQLGTVTLVYDRETKRVASSESTFWNIGTDMQVADQTVARAIDQAYKKWAPEAFDPVGEAADRLTVLHHDVQFEGSLHDLTADIFRKKTGASVALVNREMLRENILKGLITLETLHMAAPYEDQIASVWIKADRLKAMLEKSITKAFARDGVMPFGVSGLTIRVRLEPETTNLKSVAVGIHAGGSIKVALPKYVAEHCSKFFPENFCPFGGIKFHGPVRQALQSEIAARKTIQAPRLERVVFE